MEETPAKRLKLDISNHVNHINGQPNETLNEKSSSEVDKQCCRGIIPGLFLAQRAEETSQQAAEIIYNTPQKENPLSTQDSENQNQNIFEPLSPIIFTRLSNIPTESHPQGNADDLMRGLDALDQILANPGIENEYESDDLASDDDTTDSSNDSSESNHESPGKLLGEDGSDDGKVKNEINCVPRTKNEIIEARPVCRPDIILAPDAKLLRLGSVQRIVGDQVVLEGCVDGDYKVLDEDTPLFLENREIIGVVYETFGRVQAPLYSVGFQSGDEVSQFGIEIGTNLYYSPEHSKFVLTQALQGIKGSDASNIHDEEVDEAEQEFSDDEAEAEFKRSRKQEREARYSSQNTEYRKSKSNHPKLQTGPYTPLQRPSNYQLLHSNPEPASRQGQRLDNSPYIPAEFYQPFPQTSPPVTGNVHINPAFIRPHLGTGKANAQVQEILDRLKNAGQK